MSVWAYLNALPLGPLWPAISPRDLKATPQPQHIISLITSILYFLHLLL